MRQDVKDRLNKRLNDNNMTTLDTPQRLHQNRTQNQSECNNRLTNNIAPNGIPYGNGLYDDRLHNDMSYNDRLYNDRLHNDGSYNNYSTLEDPVYEARPTFLQSVTPGNEQLLIIAIAGIVAYALYLFSKSKDE